MPIRREVAQVAIGVGAALTVLGVGAAVWAATRKPKAKKVAPGSLLCPGHVGRDPAATASLTAGDFVVVQLRSGDRSFSEKTWATVIDAPRDSDSVVAVITGELVESGVRPLHTEKHGFRLGHRLVLPRDCIWEVFSPEEHGGQILCGAQIYELADFLGETGSLFPLRAGLTVQLGDRAQIVVGSEESFGNAWFELIWTKIVTISTTGQVITAMVVDTPERTEHGLMLGSVVRFNRDCIVGV